jgi:hypothetical protein
LKARVKTGGKIRAGDLGPSLIVGSPSLVVNKRT